jgi:hypothetical protein
MDQVRLDIERQALARPVAGWRTPRRKPHALPFGSQNRTLGEAERGPQVTGHRVTCGFVVGVTGFEPAASSSRSQRVRSPATALTLSDLPRTVRGRPLASAGGCGGCYSFSYSP